MQKSQKGKDGTSMLALWLGPTKLEGEGRGSDYLRASSKWLPMLLRSLELWR